MLGIALLAAVWFKPITGFGVSALLWGAQYAVSRLHHWAGLTALPSAEAWLPIKLVSLGLGLGLIILAVILAPHYYLDRREA